MQVCLLSANHTVYQHLSRQTQSNLLADLHEACINALSAVAVSPTVSSISSNSTSTYLSFPVSAHKTMPPSSCDLAYLVGLGQVSMTRLPYPTGVAQGLTLVGPQCALAPCGCTCTTQRLWILFTQVCTCRQKAKNSERLNASNSINNKSQAGA